MHQIIANLHLGQDVANKRERNLIQHSKLQECRNRYGSLININPSGRKGRKRHNLRLLYSIPYFLMMVPHLLVSRKKGCIVGTLYAMFLVWFRVKNVTHLTCLIQIQVVSHKKLCV